MKAIILRKHQEEDVARILLGMGRAKRVLYVLPTGAGKTVVAAALIRSWVADHQRVLFLAHRRELIHQAYVRLLSAGVPQYQLGVIMAKDPRNAPGAAVQIASVDTLRNRELPAADVLVIDEAHRAAAKTYRAIAEATNCPILGLTATPVRMNGRGLADAFDEMIAGAGHAALIEARHLATIRTWTVPADQLPDLSEVPVVGGEYSVGGAAKKLNRRELVGNIVEHWTRIAEGRPTITFATTVEHSRAILQAFLDKGIAAEHLDKSTPRDVRDGIVRRLRGGETKVITNCGVLIEGWDAPEVKCCIMARPTLSTGLYLQMAGRIVRPPVSPEAIILDHAGNALVHGLPQMAREWRLFTRRPRHPQQPLGKACPSCNLVVARGARICECGYEFWAHDAPPEVEGELIEVRTVTRVCALCGAPRELKRRFPSSPNKALCRVCTQLVRLRPNVTPAEAREHQQLRQQGCEQCGSPLPKRKKDQRRCRECRLGAWEWRKKCRCCGKEFQVLRGQIKKYCSKLCAKKGVAQRMRGNTNATGRASRRREICQCGNKLGDRNKSGFCAQCWERTGYRRQPSIAAYGSSAPSLSRSK